MRLGDSAGKRKRPLFFEGVLRICSEPKGLSGVLYQPHACLGVYVCIGLCISWLLCATSLSGGQLAELAGLRADLLAALKGGKYAEAAKIVGDIGILDTPQAAESLVSLGSRAPHPVVYEACVNALSATRSESVVDKLVRQLTAKTVASAALAAEALTKVKGFDQKVQPALTKAFLDLRRLPESETLQVTLLAWLRGKRGERWALQALIDLRVELIRRKISDGRLFFGVVEALWDLTRQEYTNAEDWEKYRDTMGSQPGWEPPAPEGSFEPSAQRTAVAIRRAPRFFDQEVRSTRALFILDVSSSMLDVDPGQKVEEEEEAAAEPEASGKTDVGPAKRKAGRPEPEFGEPGRRSRIDRVKRQFFRMIQQYPDGRQFAVIAFGSDVELVVGARKGARLFPIPMSSVSRDEALEKVLALEAKGITRTDLAFEMAFRFEGIDTIYILSDGYPQRDPNLGQLTAAEKQRITSELMQEIRDLVWRKNRIDGRRWEINALGFPKANLGSFLGVLARENYGKFSEVR